MMKSSTSWTVLAHLLRPQGRKGELLAELFTDFPERFNEHKRVFLAKPGFDGTAEEARATEVAGYWLPVGRNEGRIVLQIAGVDSITAAESVAGLEVLIPQEERLPLDDESVYISELIGCTVYDNDVPVGVIEDVQFPATADGARLEKAAPLLEVRTTDGDEVLIPFAKEFVVTVDTAAKRVEMKLPVELNFSTRLLVSSVT